MENKNQIGFQIRQLNNMFMRYMESAINSESNEFPKVTHGWVLRYLVERKKKGLDTYQKDVEQDFKMSRAAVTKILTSLEDEGYISREAVDFDARLKKVVISTKGEKAHKNVVESIEQIEKNLENNISKEELAIFFRVTSQVKENIIDMEKKLKERSK